MTNRYYVAGTFLALLFGGLSINGQTLPVRHDKTSLGRYPGNPKENFSPGMKTDNVRRNVALNRAAFSSDSYDYNLSAQLITDGIVPQGEVPMLSVNGKDGLLSRRAREGMLDFGEFSRS